MNPAAVTAPTARTLPGSAAVAAYTSLGPVSADDLRRRASGAAAALAKRPERRWALACDDTLAFAVGLLALARTGKTVVLPHAPQTGSLTAAQGIEAVLTDAPGRFPGHAVLDIAEAAETPARDEDPEPDAGLVLELYTSGSTGEPKRVEKTWGQLQTEVESLEREYGELLGDAAVIATVPYHHLYGLLFRVLWPLHAGRPLYAPTCLQPYALKEAAAAFTRCVLVSSPAFLTRVEDIAAAFPPRDAIAGLFSSGAPLPAETAERIHRDLGRAATEVYGSTETGGVAWRATASAAAPRPWQPFPAVETELREDAEGGKTRLWVRSPWTWRAGWVDTGDAVELVAHGRFELKGRADSVVKLEDKRISLAEMARWLGAHEWVAEARLVLVPGKRQVIGAAVVLNPAGRRELVAQGERALREALAAVCRARYEAVLCPRKWRFPDALPVNDMGKTEERRLLELFEAKP
jgi:acyl-coenzyme A synthetase/AMP-(fatty) acid ligase